MPPLDWNAEPAIPSLRGEGGPGRGRVRGLRSLCKLTLTVEGL
jgi:hypothetical protein